VFGVDEFVFGRSVAISMGEQDRHQSVADLSSLDYVGRSDNDRIAGVVSRPLAGQPFLKSDSVVEPIGQTSAMVVSVGKAQNQLG
jgi:hypothetical protein